MRTLMSFIRVPVGLLMLALPAFCSCFRQTTQVAEIPVPQMQSELQARYLTSILETYYKDMIFKAEADLPARALRITYNTNQLRLKNLEGMIADLGFDAGATRATRPLPDLTSAPPAAPSPSQPGVAP